MEQATETRKAKKPTTTERPLPQAMHADRARPAEQVRNQWACNLPAEYELSDVSDPRLWVHAGRRMKLGDWVECRHPKWIAFGLVVDLIGTAPKIAVLGSANLDEDFGSSRVGFQVPAGYTIRRARPGESVFGDSDAHWFAIRDRDQVILNKSMRSPTFEDAYRELMSSAIFRQDGVRAPRPNPAAYPTKGSDE
ncbi:MAG: hypothetical protein AB1430_09225 [Pseudomonadota bacterium]